MKDKSHVFDPTARDGRLSAAFISTWPQLRMNANLPVLAPLKYVRATLAELQSIP